MRNAKIAAVIAMAMLFGSFAARASAADLPSGTQFAQAPTVASVGQGGTGASIINPLPGEQITDLAPMIAVRLPEIASGPAVIYIMVDGNDVSEEAAISSELVFYTPTTDLKLGVHSVVVGVFTDESRTVRLANLFQWQFVVSKTAGAAPVQVGGKQPPTGRITITATSININGNDRAHHRWTDPSEIKYRGSQKNIQAPIINPVVDITSSQFGKNYVFHYDRSVREFTGRPYERGYLSMRMADRMWTIGDMTLSDSDYSELSISNLSMRGIKSVHTLGNGYSLSAFYGRTLDPPDSRLKRFSQGFSVIKDAWRGHTAKITLLKSEESFSARPAGATKNDHNTDAIFSFKDTYRRGNRFTLSGETAIGNHRGPDITPASKRGPQDSAYRLVMNYSKKNLSVTAGRRSFGPKFNPTSAQNVFSERDREGNYGSTGLSGKWWTLSSSYDDYHNNLHHNSTGNITTDYTNYNGSLGLNIKHLPRISWGYTKNYSLTDGKYGLRNTGRTESTFNTVNANYPLNDLWVLNGNSMTAGFVEGAVDNESYRDTVIKKYNSWFHIGSRNFSFNTRFKDKLSIGLKTSLSKNRSLSFNPPYNTLDMPKYTTKNWKDSVNVQWFAIPFKLVVTTSYSRDVTNNWLTYPRIPTRAPELKRSIKDDTYAVSFLYYITQKKRLTLDLSNFSRQFRDKASLGKSYDETIASLTYSVDF